MYEPVILEKRKPRTIAGTPAGKFTVFKNCLIIGIPFGALFLLSHFITKKRKIITELDEYDPRGGRMGLVLEYLDTMDFWSRIEFQGVIQYVLRRNQNDRQLLKNILPTETSKVDT
ncbi:uncharacterized protein LOC143423896 [Xylocopa sonorina]|uniref:uncharacterized protein LOC143423896 n=1 Tax=Xylocopa sonorina TaxID=1818115 RepID=UPI00403A8BA2